MINNYTVKNSYKKLKIILLIFFSFLMLLVGLSHFFAYKLKQESEKIIELSQKNHAQRDLHTLCMLDYMMNPNGKNILEDCKKIEMKQIKIDTPYLDFYFKYLE